MKKVIIATSSKILSDAIKQALEDEWHVQICTDGYSALEALRYLQPEGLVLSLDLVGKNGLEVLHQCFPDIPPATLVISSFVNDYIAQSCFNLGIHYLMRLPCEVFFIKNRLNDIWEAWKDQ